jgi:hypothetical protein
MTTHWPEVHGFAAIVIVEINPEELAAVMVVGAVEVAV